MSHPFELPDAVYWGDMSRALGPFTDRLGEQAFQGLVVDAPARCVLGGERHGLPLVGLHRVSFRDSPKQPFTARAIVMASRVEDGRAWARLVVPPEPEDDADPTPPASGEDPGVGFYTSNFALDLTELGVPRDAGTSIVAAAALGALCSNRTRIDVVADPRAIVDRAVEALAEERLAAARPEPVQPTPAGASPTYAKQVDSPALPAGKGPALALSVPRRGKGGLPVKGSFRLPVRPRFLVRPTVEGAPLDVGDPLAKAVLPLAIVVTGDQVPGPWVVPLRVAAHQAPGPDGLVTGHFALDLLADGGLRVRTRQRYVLYALAGEAFAGPYEVERRHDGAGPEVHVSTATKKVKTVAVGKETTLDLKVSAKTTDGDPVTFKILKKSDDSEVDTVDGTLKKGAATAKWTAKGPEADGDERAFRVYYTAEAAGVTATSEEMEVYLETLELTSCEEDGSTSLPDARFQVVVKNELGKEVKRIKGHTGSAGKFTVQNIPPGDLEVVWGAPVRWKGWQEDKAGKKTAKLKKSFKAQLLFPTEGAHTQYVNLGTTKDHPEWGNRLKVRVGVHPDDGPSRAGDTFFCKVLYETPDELSKRKDPERKLIGGKKLDWSDPDLGVTVEVKKDGAEATFELELGLAGGDQATIKVGGTETCEDGTVVVTSWRKLFYVLQRNESSVLHGVGRVATTLVPVFVEYEQHSEEKFKKSDTPASMAGSWVDSAEFGAAAGTDRIVIGSHNRKWFRERFDALDLPKDTKKCIVDLVVCDQQYDGNDGWNKPFKKQLTTTLEADKGPSVEWPGELFPLTIQDGKHPMTSGSWQSKAPKGTPFFGRKGKVTPDMVSVDRSSATNQVQIDLTKAPTGDPASIVGDTSGTDDKYPIDVTLTLVYADGPYLGESANNHQLIVLQPGCEAFNDTITHELGHNMRQVVSKGNAPPKDLKLADHTEAYEGHGHQGPHCSNNLDSVATHVADADHPWDTTKYTAVAGSAKDEPDYELLRLSSTDKKGAYGNCVMFGAGPDTDPSPATEGFCDLCKPFVKAAPLKSVS